MPNHVRTVVKFHKLKKEDIDIILNLIACPADEEYAIDFNKIIPEPTTREECPEDCIATPDSHIESDSERPWFNWYEWHVKYWGTKWGAYDCYTKIGKSYIQFVFSTAWSLAYPVMEKLALMGYNIEIKYADEDLGNNCGKLTYSSEQGWNHYDESELKDSYRFASELWKRY